MPRAFVCVGSNIEPARHVLQAVVRLCGFARVVGVSTVYRTAAINRPEQPDYYNCVIDLDTELPPLEVKRLLNEVEQEMGRQRSRDKYAARCIDLDLVVYDGLVSSTPELTIPDPDILSRAFLAAGLCELAPTMVLPGSERSIGAVAAELGADELMPVPWYTKQLRQAVRAAMAARQDSGG
jgi:2-amino-4-hydroxy-6-hydroxymethyldihydropteridine diphosphokinase